MNYFGQQIVDGVNSTEFSLRIWKNKQIFAFADVIIDQETLLLNFIILSRELLYISI